MDEGKDWAEFIAINPRVQTKLYVCLVLVCLSILICLYSYMFIYFYLSFLNGSNSDLISFHTDCIWKYKYMCVHMEVQIYMCAFVH